MSGRGLALGPGDQYLQEVGKCDNLRKHDHMYIWCFAGQDSELVNSHISTDKAT